MPEVRLPMERREVIISTTGFSKPPYRVPSMVEIAEIPWNGFKVASTFSGCGGSCLGYRMAGFRVVWANEFVPAAQASYQANVAEGCHLDCRDIKHVQPSDIFTATGLAEGELDLFDGSPPCQAFSTAGKREKGWGHDKMYEHGAKQKNETLFTEYIRLLRGLKPRIFVAENVSGLVKGTAKGYFLDILAGLKASGYRVSVKVLDAQWLGVPQQRQRVIFIGVREDLRLEPVHPSPMPYRYSVRDALPWIVKSTFDPRGQFAKATYSTTPHGAITTANRSHITIESEINISCNDAAVMEVIVGNDAFESKWGPPDSPSPTATTAPSKQMGFIRNKNAPTETRKFTIAELRRICAFPDDFILCGSYAQQWERLGNSVPPLMAKAIGESVLSVLQKSVKGSSA